MLSALVCWHSSGPFYFSTSFHQMDFFFLKYNYHVKQREWAWPVLQYDETLSARKRNVTFSNRSLICIMRSEGARVKGYLLHHSIPMTSGKGKATEMSRSVAAKGSVWGRIWLQRDSMRKFFESYDKLFCILIVVVVTKLYGSVKTHRIIQVKRGLKCVHIFERLWKDL